MSDYVDVGNTEDVSRETFRMGGKRRHTAARRAMLAEKVAEFNPAWSREVQMVWLSVIEGLIRGG